MRLIHRFLSKPLRFLALVIVGASLSIMAACALPSNEIGKVPPAIETTSGTAEIALADHLSSIGTKKYGAWWCPHCHAQQALFGKDAFEKITYMECDPEGQDSKTTACQTAGVQSFPTWEINGELYPGVHQLAELASLSDYSGPMDFKNQLPTE